MILLIMALNQWLSKQMYRFHTNAVKMIDERMKQVTEGFKAINIIKFNAWEEKFLAKIQKVRSKELRMIWKLIDASERCVECRDEFYASFGQYRLFWGLLTCAKASVDTSDCVYESLPL